MPRKRYSTEQIVTKLRQAEVEMGRGLRTSALLVLAAASLVLVGPTFAQEETFWSATLQAKRASRMLDGCPSRRQGGRLRPAPAGRRPVARHEGARIAGARTRRSVT